jgi:diacylglycerol kinase
MIGERRQREYIPPEQDKSLIGTMRINPKPYKAVSNRGDIDRTKFALAGLLYMLRREQTIRNLFMTSVLVLILGLWLRIDMMHAVMIYISLAMVWTTETINSAVEAVVDLVTHDLHPMAKVAKDVAAAATLIATLTSLTTTLLLLGPPLLKKLNVLNIL